MLFRPICRRAKTSLSHCARSSDSCCCRHRQSSSCSSSSRGSSPLSRTLILASVLFMLISHIVCCLYIACKRARNIFSSPLDQRALMRAPTPRTREHADALDARPTTGTERRKKRRREPERNDEHGQTARHGGARGKP